MVPEDPFVNKTVFIVGPTASGKSGFAVALAKMLQGEIISADSMQIYRGLDIGTAKIAKEEMQGVPHHMLDIVDPDASFSVQQFQRKADSIIQDLQRNDRVPIVAGGTGLYIQSLLFDLDFGRTRPDTKYRTALETLSNTALYEQLKTKNPKEAEKIHPNNRRRLIRALEILSAGQMLKRDRFDTARKDRHPVIFGLQIPREILHKRIEMRVDQMIQQGLIDECLQTLYPLGRQTQAAAAIGYAETIDYLKGLCTQEEWRRNIIVHTRQYAKRQMTWFRRLPVRWIPYDTDPATIGKELLL